MGEINLDNTGSGGAVTLSSDGTSLLLDGSAIGGGGGADLYAANEVSVTAQPSATGDDAVAIGDSASAAAANSFAIGHNASTSSAASYSIALGRNAATTGNNGAAVGYNSTAGTQAVALGTSSVASGNNSLAGPNATASASNSYALGQSASASNFGGAAFGKGATTAVNNYNVAIGNSYTSGEDAFSAAIANNTSSYGATGTRSIAIGDRAKSAGYGGVSIGQRATASGNYSMALGAGNGVVEATVADAIAVGTGAYSNLTGKLAFSSGTFGTSLGHAQTGIFVLRRSTTDATPNVLATTSSSGTGSNQVVLPNNSALSFHGTIVARQQASQGTASAAWKVEGLIRREGSAGTTVLVNSATTVLDNTPSWGMALSADTTNGGLAITVTGAASTNIRWVGTIHTSEVTYA